MNHIVKLILKNVFVAKGHRDKYGKTVQAAAAWQCCAYLVVALDY